MYVVCTKSYRQLYGIQKKELAPGIHPNHNTVLGIHPLQAWLEGPNRCVVGRAEQMRGWQGLRKTSTSAYCVTFMKTSSFVRSFTLEYKKKTCFRAHASWVLIQRA